MPQDHVWKLKSHCVSHCSIFSELIIPAMELDSNLIPVHFACLVLFVSRIWTRVLHLSCPFLCHCIQTDFPVGNYLYQTSSRINKNKITTIFLVLATTLAFLKSTTCCQVAIPDLLRVRLSLTRCQQEIKILGGQKHHRQQFSFWDLNMNELNLGLSA